MFPTLVEKKKSLFFDVFFFGVTHTCPLAPDCTLPISHPSRSSTPAVTQPKAVDVRGNLGPSTKLSWLFLLWADAPISVAAAAKYVMFSCSVPKRASSELIDSKIILGGMEGWGLKHTRDRAGPWGQEVCAVGCV